MKKLLIVVFVFNFISSLYATAPVKTNADKMIWYTYPGEDWKTQSLHIGNGYMGASFYGGIESEKFDIAEKTFWAGGPNVVSNYNYGIIEGGKENISSIRRAIVEGNIAKADSLANRYMKGNYDGFGYLSKVGDLKIDFEKHNGEATEYIRGVDLANSIGFVQYNINNIRYNREYFCSYPDKVMAVRVSANEKGQVGFTVYQDMFHKVESVDTRNGNELVINGLIEDSGLKYCARIKVLSNEGKISTEWGKLKVSDANEATILYTVSTEYDAESPLFKGKNPFQDTQNSMDAIASDTYASVKARHVQDYKNLFDRVSFQLTGDKELEQSPTNERIEWLKKGMTDDSALKALLFNLGRYLVISASRPGTLPSTLQGVWNGFRSAPWSGNYQSNINLQEMYWACGPTDLPECQEAYIGWIKGLIEPGRKVAQAYYGTNGWVSHATGNIWKYVSPGTDLLWGMYPSGSAWHCRHLWTQYEFTGNISYLKETAYPIMKEAALFYLENMTVLNNEYVMIPSASAEHGIEMKDGRPVEYSTVNGEDGRNKLLLYPSFQDVEMIYDLYSNVISASGILKTDTDFRNKLSQARNKLAKLRIGKYGQLQEWLLDVDNPRDHHRHIPHLYALFPGEMITSTQTRDLFNAARVSLNMRGEGVMNDRWPHAGGNWSMAWRTACWTRLLDGERASKVFNLMIKNTAFENMMTSQSGNMQVDAAMATPGIFAEMILQSHDGYIHLLPALPSEWPEGEVKGLVARGGYKVDLSWKYGRLVKAEIAVPKGKPQPKLRVADSKIQQTNSRIRFIPF